MGKPEYGGTYGVGASQKTLNAGIEQLVARARPPQKIQDERYQKSPISAWSIRQVYEFFENHRGKETCLFTFNLATRRMEELKLGLRIDENDYDFH